MAPNSKRSESRRMTRGAAKLAKIQLPEYKNSDWKNYTWCLLCVGNKRRGFYTTRTLKEHYAERHKRHFGRDPVPKSKGELRTNEFCVTCRFYVSDMIEHQTTVHVPKNFRGYACADCDDRFVLCHQLERHVALLECRQRMGALVKTKKREHAVKEKRTSSRLAE